MRYFTSDDLERIDAFLRIMAYNVRDKIQVDFAAFHRRHPEILEKLVRMAREIKGRGFQHYGIARLWEQLRWHSDLEHGPDSDYKFPNNYRSRYSRLIMGAFPQEFAGFFRTAILDSEM